jgi:hypothetical protein
LSFVPNDFFWDSYGTGNDDDVSCTVNGYIWPLCWITQFTLLGGEIWFAVLSVDIHVSLTNPFSSHLVNDKYYTALVCFIGGLTATLLVCIRPIQYGLSTDPMIWVKDQKDSVNWTKMLMFYIWLPFIYTYCAVIALWARWQIHRGLEDTLKMRKYSVSKQTRCKNHFFLDLVSSFLICILFSIGLFRCLWLFWLLFLPLFGTICNLFERRF